MNGTKKPSPYCRAVGGVGDHARPVVLAEHRQDARADEQPQQTPALAVRCARRCTRERSCERAASSSVSARSASRRRGGGLRRCSSARPPPRQRPACRPGARARRASRRRAAPPSACSRSPKRTNSGPPNGWRSRTTKRSPGRDAALGEVAQHLRVGVRDAHEQPAIARLAGSPGVGRRAPRARGRRSGSGRRADRRSDGRAWRRSAPRDPRRARARAPPPRRARGPRASPAPRRDSLEQAVVADHLERHAPPVVGQPHAAVGRVRDQAELVEALEHRRDRAGRDAQALGERVRGHRLVAARFQREDRLRVVLDGRRTAILGGHGNRIWHAKRLFKASSSQVIIEPHTRRLERRGFRLV